MLAVVAEVWGFALFENRLLKLVSSCSIYAGLLTRFLTAYARHASIGDMQYFALAAGMVVFSGTMLLERRFLRLPVFRALQLAKRFLKTRKFRYISTLFSISAYAASITVLSAGLQPYVLPLLSGIVICIVANTMLGNVYQRSREIFTLATVGLNPDHFVGFFMAEAFIMGFISGGIGYSIGLSVAVLGPLPLPILELSSALMVEVMLLSTAVAFIGSVLPGLKASMMATPSLLKRWWREAPPIVGWPPKWTFTIPVKVTEETAEDFLYYFMERLATYERFVKPIEEAYDFDLAVPARGSLNEKTMGTLSFRYILNDGTYALETKNNLRITRTRNEKLEVDLTIYVTSYQQFHELTMFEYLEKMATNFRRISFEWTRE